MRVFSVTGLSDSGKTSTIESLLPEMRRRGYSVASVKDIHNDVFAIDRVGSNTYRHGKAGAQIVVARGLKETDVLIPSRLSAESILAYLEDFDFVVWEGASSSCMPKIFCAVEKTDLERIAGDQLIFAISGCISNKSNGETYMGMPIINGLSDINLLVDLVVEKVPEALPFQEEKDECGQYPECTCRKLLADILLGHKKRNSCCYKREKDRNRN